MKAKKISLIAAMVLAVVCFLTISAWAGNYTCTVVSAGPSSSSDRIFIMLTDEGGAFTDTWFRVSYDREKQFLATALTAMSGNMKVKVNCNGVEYGILHTIYIEAGK